MVKIERFEDYIEINGFKVYVNEELSEFILKDNCSEVLEQFVNMQKLPGLENALGLPDFHGGYYFPIGSVAAMDIENPDAVVSPEGVGYDINCGVRCLKTNLNINDLNGKKEKIGDMLFSKTLSPKDSFAPIISRELINGLLEKGLKYLYEIGKIDEKEMEYTESGGSLEGTSKLIDQKSKARGMAQLGSLGSGNHYLEIQVVEKILDEEKASVIGICEGQLLISIHTGSRGLGHGICSNFIENVKKERIRRANEAKKKKCRCTDEKNDEKCRKTFNIRNDKEVLYVPYKSMEGDMYMRLMSSAANYAWANRSVLTSITRKVLESIFSHVQVDLISDVSHNIARKEIITGKKELLVHRKGASRILPPKHPDLPSKYKDIGQPILIGGSMGTCSFLVTGAKDCNKTYYSAPHGAGRVVTRVSANETFKYQDVISDMEMKGILVRCESKKGLVEESANCYKDVEKVVNHAENIGILVAVAKLKPVIVIKGD